MTTAFSKNPMMVKRPRTELGQLTSDNMTATTIALLGGSSIDQVAFSSSQVKAMAKLYGFDLNQDHPLQREGVFRNISRCAKSDGLRIVAFMARFCKSGEDPLSLIKRALSEYGLDVQLEEQDFEDDDWEDE